jgi:hypothetical protein
MQLYGTLGMLDPTFLKRESGYTGGSDVFSLGGVLFYLIAGRRLIEGTSQKELFDKNVNLSLP